MLVHPAFLVPSARAPEEAQLVVGVPPRVLELPAEEDVAAGQVVAREVRVEERGAELGARGGREVLVRVEEEHPLGRDDVVERPVLLRRIPLPGMLDHLGAVLQRELPRAVAAAAVDDDDAAEIAGAVDAPGDVQLLVLRRDHTVTFISRSPRCLLVHLLPAGSDLRPVVAARKVARTPAEVGATLLVGEQ